MTKKHHYKTSSNSKSGPGYNGYIDKQKRLIKNGKWCEALMMDIVDVNRIAPGKYNVGIAQMIGHTYFLLGETCN